MNYFAHILVVAPPGRLRDALQAILRAMPQVTAVSQADNCTLATPKMLTDNPNLIFIDADVLPMGQWHELRHLKENFPDAKCIFIANTLFQSRQAQEAGVDAVLVRGFSSFTLNNTIADTLNPPTATLSTLFPPAPA